MLPSHMYILYVYNNTHTQSQAHNMCLYSRAANTSSTKYYHSVCSQTRKYQQRYMKYSTVHSHNVSFNKSAKQLQCYFNWCIHRNPFYSRYDTPTTDLVLILHALLILIPPKDAGTGLILMPVFGAALLYTQLSIKVRTPICQNSTGSLIINLGIMVSMTTVLPW